MSNQLQKVQGEKYLYFRPIIKNHSHPHRKLKKSVGLTV